jgi:Ser-tRNA(Ala) deacylase AlaX
MSIHTAQHLLSAVLDRYDLPTLSWSLTSYPSLEPPYIELARNLTWAEAEEVEAKCNALIQEGKRVWVDVDMQEEGFVKMTTVGVRENRGIPTDYTDVRLLSSLEECD